MNKNFAYLWDMYQAAQKIQDFTQDLDWNTYQNNSLVQSAVERQFEIMGEAARRVSEDFQDNHPTIPWSDLIGQRNIIAHQYEKIDQERIWLTIHQSLPKLVEALKDFLPEF